ncbi:DUF262 domain-containing protein [Photobacterium kishitanii]|uniref:DUF262 domain-containing protein n=1 Tax=Photobacterium kishitanii TaxID=318456 RepID=UPI000436C515|nr:DUF262 domain-containing protein [Photobacterium kishitanii]OBU29084.1 hypothetical protein AYY22_00675 [Photobacterium kishitanii]PSW69410.1 DUF262 domain-containing protein [Photobacterium kishitanii]CEO39412.1 conserved hypothetical protein [Photobacterium kishitanii]
MTNPIVQLAEIQDNIISEIEHAKQNIKTDGYPMSIGEIINLYRDGDIILDPAFQRLYRWEDEQKTKLIESILIGIPIPEIFVAQKADNTWHVVDGVQRLSTILQLAGVLDTYTPLTLQTCKYIPSLEGQSWKTLPIEIQRAFRRSKIKISIILTQNSDEAQYELFQRLNTGGSALSPQEVRNCLMLMINPEFFDVINELKDYDNFKQCLQLNEDDYKKENHMELILRMFIGYENKVKYEEYGSLHSIIMGDFIDKETIRLMKNSDTEKFKDIFKRTFDKLKNCLADQSFHKYDIQKDRFKGGFNVSVFEMLTIGISSNITQVEQLGNDLLIAKIKEIYVTNEIQTSFGRGVRAIKRFKDVTNFSKTYFE